MRVSPDGACPGDSEIAVVQRCYAGVLVVGERAVDGEIGLVCTDIIEDSHNDVFVGGAQVLVIGHDEAAAGKRCDVTQNLACDGKIEIRDDNAARAIGDDEMAKKTEIMPNDDEIAVGELIDGRRVKTEGTMAAGMRRS